MPNCRISYVNRAALLQTQLITLIERSIYTVKDKTINTID